MFNLPLASPFELKNIPQRLSRITWISTSIICLWTFFYPLPYYLSIGIGIAFIPALAVVALYLPNGRNKESTLYNSWNDIRFFILGPMLVLATVIALRIEVDNQITGSLDFYLWVATISFILSIIVYLIFRKGIGICLVMSTIYTLGVCIFLNGFMLSETKIIHHGILEKKYGSIKPVQNHFHINSNSQIVHVVVNSSTYAKSALGTKTCYSKQNGRFGLEILEYSECPIQVTK